MKTWINLLTFLIILAILPGCKKDSTDNTSNSSAVIFSTTFEDQTALNAWSQTTGGQAVIDSSAVKFTNITECFHFETINLIPVVNGKTYELSLTGKVNSSQTGDPAMCVGDFMVYVVQGSTNLISDGFGKYPAWTERNYSFTATSSAAVKIKFLIGTTRGAWIKEIKLTQK
jgi:hypothetical protein